MKNPFSSLFVPIVLAILVIILLDIDPLHAQDSYNQNILHELNVKGENNMSPEHAIVFRQLLVILPNGGKDIGKISGISSIQPIISVGLKNKIIRRANGYIAKNRLGSTASTIHRKIELASKLYLVTFKNASLSQKAYEILSQRGFHVEKNGIVRSLYNPSDTYFNSFGAVAPGLRDTWGLEFGGFPAAWDITRGDQSIVTAVLDTGVQLSHPDLGFGLTRMWRNSGEPIPPNGIDDDLNGYTDDFQGWDFVNGVGWHGSYTWNDDNGHGTAVTGIIAADSDNSIGIPGGSFAGKYMNLKVLNLAGMGTISGIASGMAYAIAMGADIINMSLGGPGRIMSFETQAALANSLGIALIVAAGNDSTDARSMSPANIKDVITIGALTYTNDIASFSNIGSAVDIFAAGDQIISLTNSGGYGFHVGTSFSSPLVAGAANLLKANIPSLNGEQLRQALRVAALQKSGETGIVDDKQYGDLAINLALTLAPLPEVRITSPTFFTPKVQTSVTIEGYIRNPGGIPISQSELAYREVGSATSNFLTSLGGTGPFTYQWNLSGLPDGNYYIELRARTAPSAPWAIDSMLVRKGISLYEDISDPAIRPSVTLGLEGVDIDNDGDRDIIISDLYFYYYLGVGLPPMNLILVNDGGGNFTDESFRFRLTYPEAPTLELRPVDLNGDGFIDFIERSSPFTVMREELFAWINDGTGYFDQHPVIPGLPWGTLGATLEKMALGDTDGDGDQDMLIPTISGLYFFRNDGFVGGRIQVTDIASSSGIVGTRDSPIILADFDNDGDLDVQYNGGIFQNLGGNQFIDVTSSSGTPPQGRVAVDMDGDGDIDIIGKTHTSLNQGSGFFTSYQYAPPGGFYQIEVGDIDRDSLPDIAVIDENMSNFYVFQNRGYDPTINSIRFEDKTVEWLSDTIYLGMGTIEIIDFFDKDGDGDLDLMVGGETSASSPFPTYIRLLENHLAIALLGDVNQDGRITIIDALLVAQYAAGLITLSAEQLIAGDVNQSGVVDILDALIIAQIAAGLIPPPPAPASPSQEYCAYVPCPY